MRLDRLDLDRLPGIREPFTLRPAAGVNVILGPNGAGKSSVCRAVGRLLWNERHGDSPFAVTGVFSAGADTWSVSRRDDEAPVWLLGAEPTVAPVLPAVHLARCYLLGLADLIDQDSAAGDRDLAAEIQKQLAGGYDLAGAREALFASTDATGRSQRRNYDETAKRVRELRREQDALVRQRDELPALEEELDRARRAGDRARLLAKILERLHRRDDLADAESRLATLPEAVGRVREEDPQTAADLLRELREQQDRIAEMLAGRKRLAREMDALDLTPAARGDLDTADLDERERRLRSLQEACNQAATARERELARHHILDDGGETKELPTIGDEALQELVKLQQQFLRQQALIDELEKLEEEAVDEPAGRGWLAAVLPGALLLVAGAAGRFWPDAPVPEAALLAGIVAGVSLLFVGTTLRSRSAGARTDRERAAHRRVLRLEGARGKLEEIRTGLGNWNHELGLNLEVDDPRLADLIRESEARRQARGELAQAEAEMVDRTARRDAALGECNEIFVQLGLQAATDAEDASRRIGALLRRRAEWDTLQQKDRNAAATLETESRHYGNRSRDLKEIVDRLGLADDEDPATVAAALAEQQPRWRLAVRDRDEARRDIRRLDEEIQPRAGLLEGLDADTLAEEELERRISAEQDAAASHEELSRRKGALEAELARAEKQNDLAEALAAQEEALQVLADARAAVRDDELGRLLCDDVLEQQGADAASPILQSARENFTRFTQGRWELKVDARTGGQPFFAWDADRSARRELSQLSDGTRTQLLLAVRLAFLTFAETSLRPPLFLDQALAASDPDRFDRIACSIGRAAHEQQRQVFYLGCDAGDVEAWNRALRHEGLPEVTVIDLAAERSGQAASPRIFSAPVPRTAVPAPEGRSDAQYAQALNVPPIDPWAPETAVHLLHLLRDDLPLLHRLLTAGVQRLGSWRNARRHLTDAGEQTAVQADRVQARGEAAGAFLDAWRIGRSRPLEPEWIREREIFKSKLPEVLDLNEELGRDPERLMSALRSKRIKRLQTAMQDEFENALLASGHLDRQPILDAEALVLAMRRAVTTELREGILESGEVRRLADTLTGALSTSAPAGESKLEPEG